MLVTLSPILSEANVLVPIQSKARISNTPTSKTVIITIHKKTEKTNF